MQLATFGYETSRGWSMARWPALDSENTLVLVFGASEYLDDPKPFEAHLEHSRVRFASADVADATDSFEAGTRLAAALAGDELRGVLVFSDGLAVNGSERRPGAAVPAGRRRVRDALKMLSRLLVEDNPVNQRVAQATPPRKMRA